MKGPADKHPTNWDVREYLSEGKERVESRLGSLPLQGGKPTRARDAMRYALETRGKRFRPLLTIAVADIYRKGSSDLTLDCAVAVECVHTASLIFDDLPCMDDAALRRGRKTTHTLFGEDQAILAGMSLLADANQLIAADFRGRKTEARKRLECLSVLNASYSVEGLSGGQSDDLLDKPELTFEELEYIHAKKTGSLFVACAEIGAIIGEASPRERLWLKDYAKNLGLAFQIQDDLLDLKSSDVTGKDQFKDRQKTTFVSIFGAAQCARLYNDLIQVALDNLEPLGGAAFHVRALTEVIRERQF